MLFQMPIILSTVFFPTQCTVNIIFDRVGKVGMSFEIICNQQDIGCVFLSGISLSPSIIDPVTRGLSIVVNWLGIQVDVS